MKYWLSKFRKEGMAIFPITLFDELEPQKEPAVSQTPTEEVPERKVEQEQKPKKKKKAKKAKKARKKAKVKKDTRAKKSKKKSKKKI